MGGFSGIQVENGGGVMSKDIPIIFSRPMVRALLEGRKTQTRRIIKLPTKGEYVRPDMGGWEPTTVGGGKSFVVRRDGSRAPAPEMVAIWNQTTGTCIAMNYQPGDRLWVRENFAYVGSTDPGFLTYGATYPDDLAKYGCENVPATLKEAGYKWKPSIHMPREASRLTLPVDAVKVERIQDISDEDAIAEGVLAWRDSWTEKQAAEMFLRGMEAAVETKEGTVAQRLFYLLWTGINGRESWTKNPFVVAPSFRVIKANIDAPEARAA
jgi:hypothetical protein